MKSCVRNSLRPRSLTKSGPATSTDEPTQPPASQQHAPLPSPNTAGFFPAPRERTAFLPPPCKAASLSLSPPPHAKPSSLITSFGAMESGASLAAAGGGGSSESAPLRQASAGVGWQPALRSVCKVPGLHPTTFRREAAAPSAAPDKCIRCSPLMIHASVPVTGGGGSAKGDRAGSGGGGEPGLGAASPVPAATPERGLGQRLHPDETRRAARATRSQPASQPSGPSCARGRRLEPPLPPRCRVRPAGLGVGREEELGEQVTAAAPTAGALRSSPRPHAAPQGAGAAEGDAAPAASRPPWGSRFGTWGNWNGWEWAGQASRTPGEAAQGSL